MRRLVSGPRKLDFELLLPAKDAATLVELSGTASLNSSAHITNHVTPQQHSWVSEHRDEDDVVPALERLCREDSKGSSATQVQWQPREPGQVSEGTTEPRRTTEGNQGKATDPAGQRGYQRQLPGSACAWGSGRLGALCTEWWHRWVGVQDRALACHSKKLGKFQDGTVTLCRGPWHCHFPWGYQTSTLLINEQILKFG